MSTISGTIWQVEKIKYYPKLLSKTRKAMSVVSKGGAGGYVDFSSKNKINVFATQFKDFVRIGDL